MIKAEWTNKDSLDLQPTCNQLATTEGDLISRQAAIDRATKEHDFFRGAVTVSDKARRDELLNVVCWLGELPTVKPKVLAYGSGILVKDSDPDVIRVVRCKDCAWWQREWSDEKDYHYCTMEDDRTYKEFYCANAERRTDG